jgi:pilus assembly protein TadC
MDTIGEIIQFSLAPVFLLTGIGGILGVLASRLTRIVDQGRALEERIARDPAGAGAEVRRQLFDLVHRARLTNVAISLCVLSALLVATAIVALFVSAYLQFLPVLWIALLFGGALASLVGALFLFLREVYLSAATLYTDVQ